MKMRRRCESVSCQIVVGAVAGVAEGHGLVEVVDGRARVRTRTRPIGHEDCHQVLPRGARLRGPSVQKLATNSSDDGLAFVTAWTPESVSRSILHAVSAVVSSSHH